MNQEKIMVYDLHLSTNWMDWKETIEKAWVENDCEPLGRTLLYAKLVTDSFNSRMNRTWHMPRDTAWVCKEIEL